MSLSVAGLGSHHLLLIVGSIGASISNYVNKIGEALVELIRFGTSLEG